MNKFTKIILITVCVLVAIGALLTGGIFYFEKLSFFAGEDPDQGSFTKKIDNNDIYEVRINMSYGDVTFVEGTEWSVYFDHVYIPGADAEVKDNVLYIKTGTPSDIKLFGWKIGFNIDFDIKQKTKISVTYPAGQKLAVIDAQMGSGNFKSNGICADNIICQICAGNIVLKNTEIEEKGKFQSVFGTFKSENTKFRNTSVKMAVGTYDIGTDETSRQADVETKLFIGTKNGKPFGFWKK